MNITASSRRIGSSLRNVIDINGRHEMVTDEPAGLGGSDEGPAPHELLAAALAACVATMIEMYARRKEWHVEAVDVDVAYDPDAAPRAVDMEIALDGELSEDQVGRLLRVARTCPVRRAIESDVSFTESLTVREADCAERPRQADGAATEESLG
jgi:putative redox protein